MKQVTTRNIVIALIIGLGVGFWYSYSTPEPVATPTEEIASSTTAVAYTVDVGVTPESQTVTLQVNNAGTATLAGSATGTMYFEGDFGIELKDIGGTVLAIGIATAQTDWMTINIVPFVAQFTNVPANIGAGATLTFHRDNPSAMSQNDYSVVYPVSVVYLP